MARDRRGGRPATALMAAAAVAGAALTVSPDPTPSHRLSAAFVARSGACTTFAAPWGSNRWPGTRRHPYRTVRRALRRLRPGQTACLRRGTYREDVRFDRPGRRGRPVTLRAAHGEKARVVGAFWITRRARYAVVRGLFLDGRNSDDQPSPIVNARDVLIADNDVTDRHTAICLLLGSHRWGVADGAVVERNRIHGCGRLPRTGLNHGIYVEAARGAVIQDNWIYDNADYGVHLYPDAQETVVRRNVIYGNGKGLTFSGEHGYASSSNVVEHNVIAASQDGLNAESWWASDSPVGTGNVLRSNCLFGGVPDLGGGVEAPPDGFSVADNIVADPQLVDPARGDLRPLASSPCRPLLGLSAARIPGPRLGR